MPEIEERVSELEKMMKELIYVFTQGQIQHQEYRKSHEKFEKEMAAMRNDLMTSLDKFEREMQLGREKSDKDMAEFKNEMKTSNEKFEREMQLAREKSDKEMVEFKNEMKISNEKFEREMQLAREKFDKEMAAIKKDIALTLQKQGTLVEDMIAPNVKEIAEQKFGFVPPFLFMVRHKKQKPSDLSYIREFDVIAVYNERVIIVESKSNPKTEYIKEFIDFLKSGELLEYYPEFTGKKIIPILASLFIPEEVIKFLTKNRIYAMVLKGDIMDIVNDIS